MLLLVAGHICAGGAGNGTHIAYTLVVVEAELHTQTRQHLGTPLVTETGLGVVQLRTAHTAQEAHHTGSDGVECTAVAGATGSGGIGHVVGVVQTVAGKLAVEVLGVLLTENLKVADNGLASGVANDVEAGGGIAVGTHHTLHVTEDVDALGIGHLHRVAGDGVAKLLGEDLALGSTEGGDGKHIEGVAQLVFHRAVLHNPVVLIRELVVVIKVGHHREAAAHVGKGDGVQLRGVLGIGNGAAAARGHSDIAVGVPHGNLQRATNGTERSVTQGRGDDASSHTALFEEQFEGTVLANTQRVLRHCKVSLAEILQHCCYNTHNLYGFKLLNLLFCSASPTLRPVFVFVSWLRFNVPIQPIKPIQPIS